MVRGRRVKVGSNDRLTPSDLMKLIPSPVVLPGRSLAAIERQLAVRRERLQRLTARFAGKPFVTIPRQIRLPKLTRLEALAKQVETLPTRRKCLTRREFGIYMDAIRQLRSTIAGMIRKVQNIGHRSDESRYLQKIARLFLDAPPDVFASFLAGRRNRRGQNVHAMAMARMRHATSEQLSEWGRRGGKATKRKRLNAAAAPTPTQSESQSVSPPPEAPAPDGPGPE